MNLDGDIAGGKTGDLSNRRPIFAFEIERDHQPVDRSQSPDQSSESFERHLSVGVRGDAGRLYFEIFQADKPIGLGAFALDDVCRGRIVRNPVNPGA